MNVAVALHCDLMSATEQARAAGGVNRRLWVREGQATKGTRWMPRYQEAMKDVGSCDKLRGAATQALSRRFPNGTTHALKRATTR